MLPGFVSRLQKEVAASAPASATVGIIASPERRSAAWKGGAVIGRLSSFGQMAVSQQEYKETGPSIVRRKFL
jgi:actin-related protein